MKITINISNKDIRDVLESAGCGYWCKNYKVNRSKLGFTLVETGDGEEKRHTVTLAMLAVGLQKMANAKHDQGGHHFEDVRCIEQSDMYTGDAVVQFAVFGELKYG